ncbi:MAG: ATP-binding protein [Crocinitomicaceae bacterium]|nr:ATP-binding protein [Crocinitomicaceae bacterium]
MLLLFFSKRTKIFHLWSIILLIAVTVFIEVSTNHIYFSTLLLLPLLQSFFFRKDRAIYATLVVVLLVSLTGMLLLRSTINGAIFVSVQSIGWIILTIGVVELKNYYFRADASDRRLKSLTSELVEKLETQNEKLKENFSIFDENIRAALEGCGFGMWEWDAESNSIKWDTQMYRVFQLTKKVQELDIQFWENQILEVDRESFIDDFDRAIKGKKPLRNHFLINSGPKGSCVKLVSQQVEDSQGNIVKVVGLAWDVTEEKQHQLSLVEYKDQLEAMVERRTEVMAELNKSLIRSEELLKGISEIGGIGGWHYDLKTRDMNWTDEVFHIFELPIGEIPSFEEIIHFYAPEARGVVKKSFKNCEEHSEPFEFELPLVVQEDKIIWVQMKGKPVTLNGEVTAITGIIHDVSNEKEVRDSLININEQLDIQVQKLKDELEASIQELETFTYTVSHDLRSPLRAIEGFSKALLDSYGRIIDEDGERWLRYIMSNTDKMGTLITDILNFSRVGRTVVQPVEVNMNKLLEEKFDELKKDYHDKVIKLNVEKLPKVVCDKMLVGQVWNNLLNNALKFSSEKEEISIEVSSKIENDYALFTVKDFGVGFDEKYIQKLFVVFQRLHGPDEFPGSGVGLAIVDRIMRKHGGWVQAKGEEGVGASFTFALPL